MVAAVGSSVIGKAMHDLVVAAVGSTVIGKAMHVLLHRDLCLCPAQ